MELDTDELESIDLSNYSNITEEQSEESKIDE